MMIALATAAALALAAPGGQPALDPSALPRAVANYRALLAGRKQLADLPAAERLELLELDRWLRSQPPGGPGGTREQCKAAIAPHPQSGLEEALVDLKCSQRPRQGN